MLSRDGAARLSIELVSLRDEAISPYPLRDLRESAAPESAVAVLALFALGAALAKKRAPEA